MFDDEGNLFQPKPHHYGLHSKLPDEVTPDILVAIADYVAALQLYTCFRNHATGERVWASRVAMGIAAEFGIETDLLYQYQFAGSMIKEDRHLRSLTDEEREELMRKREEIDAVVDDMLDEFDFDAFFAEKAQMEAEEAELKRILGEM